METLLAIDAGTGSGRAVLFDVEGRQLAVSQTEWTHPSDPDHPGSMGFDVEPNWRLLADAVRAVLHDGGVRPDEVRAVSATSMREAIVLWDDRGRELWACANVDARAAEEVRELQRDRPDAERRFYEASGQTFALGALPRLLWVRRHRPELWERVARMSMLSDWVLARLSGELRSDPSNAGTSGVFSLSERDWAPWMARELGLPGDLFPPVVEPGTTVGAVTREAAEATGLAPGTPVVMGGGDAQLGCVGLGVVRASQVAVLGGTFWQQEANLGEPVVDPGMDIRVNPHAVPELWQAEAIVFFAGLAVRWFRDAFCGEEVREAARRGVDAYALLEAQAAEVPPGANGVLPVFSDAMRFSAWYHAAPSLLNLSLDAARCGKPALFRALQENAAVVTAANLEHIGRFAGGLADEVVFAGGAAKGPLWCQILADVTGRAVRVPVVKEATALGTAVAAGVGAGVYGALREAAEALVAWERHYEPAPEAERVYREVRARWREAYDAQRALVDAGVTASLWKAPGL